MKWETSNPANPQGREVLAIAQKLVKLPYGGNIPPVLDPFAAGGSIPRETTGLGMAAHGRFSSLCPGCGTSIYRLFYAEN